MDTRCSVEKTGQVWNLKADYDGLNSDVQYALEQLETDYIDIIVLCRVSQEIPIEESVHALQRIITEGKARSFGLSEASSSTLRRAQAVAPIAYLEQEWSLWSRDVEEDIIPVVKEFGIKFIAYSPLGRGFLTSTIENRTDLDPNDYRLHGQPKFSQENFAKNLALVHEVKTIADRLGCTTGQIALAWLYAQGSFVIPIPGTSTISHLDENIAAMNIILSTEDLAKIDEIFHPSKVVGDRYAHATLTFQGNK